MRVRIGGVAWPGSQKVVPIENDVIGRIISIRFTGPDRPDNLFGNGYGGQYLLAVPSLELIVVFTGWNIYEKPPLNAAAALDRIVSAVRER